MDKKLKKYLCGKAALEYWKVPNLKGLLEPADSNFENEYVIFTNQSIYRPNNLILHTCKIKGAEKYVKDDVCTLPLVFLQIASEYDIHKCILLGLQICSFRGNQPPLCTLEELENCAKDLIGHKGRRKALRAIKYISNESRSPMESILYMFLRLPNALGGCGFKNAIFNKKINTKSGNTYYADIYIPEIKLIAEYDSRQYHDNAKSYESDSVRASNLLESGYQVISIKSFQLKKLNHFKTLANRIAAMLGKKIRIRARKFFQSFITIYNLMTSHGQTSTSSNSKVLLHQVPQFLGVNKYYSIYLEAYDRLINYPLSPLLGSHTE